MGKNVKYIIVTGGVLSGLGKGVTSACIGKLLSNSYKVVPIKCDGYLNVDPGTMNPVEHGEVFVLDDGGEVDLDFGHYERFLHVSCKIDWNLTSGKIFQSLVEKERRGDFLGKTVQVIPHVTGEIRQRFAKIAQEENADILLIEIGGTVGDIENLWYLEAARELIQKVGRENIAFVHLGLVPEQQGEQKTKPLQQSLTMLRQHGIFPDIVVGRSRQKLTQRSKNKIHWLDNIGLDSIISNPDCESIYELPIIFQEEGLDKKLPQVLGLKPCESLTEYKELVQKVMHPSKHVKIAICGKYTELADSYISIVESLTHAGAHLDTRVEVVWVETTDFETQPEKIPNIFADIQGVIIPGGFGTRGTEGKIKAIEYVRTHDIPFLGICYGLQLAVIEFARNVCGLPDANSVEIQEQTPHPVVDLMPEQKEVLHKGASMRLGSYDAHMKVDSLIAGLYTQILGTQDIVHERHRHRFEVNPEYHEMLQEKGLVFSGVSEDKRLVEFCELSEHPYFVATQAHPELKSKLEKPGPLFYGLVQSALLQK
ncbi:MAG: glutamine hydrolyzing CTP synthase [Candidatus Woesearchaeota archaeon]